MKIYYVANLISMFNIGFLSKLAFICNTCFLIAVILQAIPYPFQGEVIATTIIIGYIFAGIINLLANGWLAILFFSKKLSNNTVPRWLIIVNLLFLIPELILFLK